MRALMRERARARAECARFSSAAQRRAMRMFFRRCAVCAPTRQLRRPFTMCHSGRQALRQRRRWSGRDMPATLPACFSPATILGLSHHVDARTAARADRVHYRLMIFSPALPAQRYVHPAFLPSPFAPLSAQLAPCALRSLRAMRAHRLLHHR